MEIQSMPLQASRIEAHRIGSGSKLGLGVSG
ncbi:MAG: hypothetical protein RIS70_2085 [Planctomycetota bacterium]